MKSTAAQSRWPSISCIWFPSIIWHTPGSTSRNVADHMESKALCLRQLCKKHKEWWATGKMCKWWIISHCRRRPVTSQRFQTCLEITKFLIYTYQVLHGQMERKPLKYCCCCTWGPMYSVYSNSVRKCRTDCGTRVRMLMTRGGDNCQRQYQDTDIMVILLHHARQLKANMWIYLVHSSDNTRRYLQITTSVWCLQGITRLSCSDRMWLHITLLQEGQGLRWTHWKKVQKSALHLEGHNMHGENITIVDDDSLVERYVLSLYGQGA
jgi:hypothetical protein